MEPTRPPIAPIFGSIGWRVRTKRRNDLAAMEFPDIHTLGRFEMTDEGATLLFSFQSRDAADSFAHRYAGEKLYE